MTTEACLSLLAGMLRTTLLISGPLLLASLVAGLAVGVVQTATQVNEPSISYLAKAGATIAVLLAMGAGLAGYATEYMRAQLKEVARVVKQ